MFETQFSSILIYWISGDTGKPVPPLLQTYLFTSYTQNGKELTA